MILGNALEEACTFAADYLAETLQVPSVDSYLVCLQVIELLQTCNISKVQPGVKQKILAFSYYVAIYKALWFGFTDILPVLCENLLLVGEEIEPSFILFVSDLIAALKQHNGQSLFNVAVKFQIALQNDKHQAMLKAVRLHLQTETHLFSEPGRHQFNVNGICLQGRQKSTLTGRLIKG